MTEIKKQFRDSKDRSIYYAKQKANDGQWWMAEQAIRAFIAKYPKHWMMFQNDIKINRSEYNLATKDNKELRQANWRNVLSFPVIEDHEREIDSLKPVIDKIIPGLSHKDSVNRKEFIKRFPFLCPGRKY